MAFSQSLGHRMHSKSQKKRLTDAQVKLLEASFGHDKKLEPEKKLQLARELGLQPRQVAVWYQNKKARWKTQALEQDYHDLQLRLDNALEAKRSLEEEVRGLRKELEQAKKMLGTRENLFASLSTSGGGGDEGSSTVHHYQTEESSYWENSELYSELTMFAHSIS